jgi:hypothetical protein
MHSIKLIKSLPKKSWSIMPETLAELDFYLYVNKPKTVLECGSGLSTLIFARYAKNNPEATVISLDHDKKYFTDTKKMLGKLQRNVKLIYAPLTGAPPVYDVDLLNYDKIDFALIDGPPAREGGRSKMFDWLFPYLSKKWEIWLDDGNRKDESTAVKQWSSDYPFLIQDTSLRKGLSILKNYRNKHVEPDVSDVFITMLSGTRPHLLEKTLSHLPVYLLNSMCGLANGEDQETIDVYRSFGIEPLVTESLLDIGNATSYLASIAEHSGKTYWLAFQDDWQFITLDTNWLQRAKKALRSTYQVRLRHYSDPVLTTHQYSKKPIKLKYTKYGSWGVMHWTFNPALMRCEDIKHIFPAESEKDAQKIAHKANKDLVHQLYPGCFLHLGWDDSLKAKTGSK